MCRIHMGIAQIALDQPPLPNGQMWKKSPPNHPGKPLHSRANVRKKVPQAILARLYTPPPLRAMPMETTHLKKGLPLV